jgi:hypothetical protein
MPYHLLHTTISRSLSLSVLPLLTKPSDYVSTFNQNISNVAALHQLDFLSKDFSTDEQLLGAKALERI